MDAIILAGGKGSRMEANLPKALVEVRGKPIIAHQIDYLLSQPGVDTIILSLGHQGSFVQEYVQMRYADTPIICSIEEGLLGTAGGLKLAFTRATSPRVLVLNCDDITDIHIADLEGGTEHMICVAHPCLPFGRVHEVDGYAVFEEKPILEDWTSCGWYCFNREELLPLLPDEGSLEYDVFPKIKLKVYHHTGSWRTLNTKKDVQEFEKG